MNRAKIFIAFAFLLAFTSQVLAQDIAGKYAGEANVEPYGKIPIKAEIRQNASKFGGLFNTSLGDSAIIEGKFTDGSLKLIVDADGSDIVLEGKLSGGKFEGKVISETLNGTFELTRSGDVLPEADLSYVLSQSKEKWHEDLRFVAVELPKRHKNAFHTVSREQFEKAVTDLDSQIPNLDDTQIALGISKLFTMIGDGHTDLQWTSAFNYVPIRFFWFGKELRVYRAGKDFQRLIGAKLVKIGGVTVEGLFNRSQPFIAQVESPQYILSANAYRLSFPAFLYALGVAKSPNSAVYEFIDTKGKRLSIELKTVPRNDESLRNYPFKNLPLWLQDRDNSLFLKYLSDSKTVYVKFQSYPRRKEFKKFSDELFAFLDKNKVDKLIFDMRLNEGGDFTRGQDYFINPLKERKNLTEKGKLFVIAGRWTFSAGMSNTAHFRNEFGAILVGEPTGARPNGYQEVRSFRLPNSHLEGSYSIELYKFAEQDTAGLIPDKLIEPDWKSFQAGNDAALNWILAYPKVK